MRSLGPADRKSTRLNSSHEWISYAVFCVKKKKRGRTDGGRRNSERDIGIRSPPGAAYFASLRCSRRIIYGQQQLTVTHPFFFQCLRSPDPLYSFPPRRSSD